MTEEEIKKIAREYAEYCCRETDYEGDIVERNMDLHICADEVAMPLLEWLSKDYCIVPKVEILNQHAWYMQRMKEVSSNRQMNRGKAIALENLFGREMFEEDKK